MATPADLPEPGSPDATVVFDDGLGVRRLEYDETSGDLVEKLYVSLMLSKHSAALRERATRLANFRHPRFPRVRGVEVSDDHKVVAVVSDPVEGVRLSEVIAQSQQNRLGIEVHAALQVGREVLPALATLHGSRTVTHGALAAERLVLTRTGRIVVSDYSLGAAMEKLQYPRPRLWKDFRVAMPPAAGMPRFDPRADVAHVALVMLELILGRPLTVTEFPDSLKTLLGAASERLGARAHRPLSSSLRAWFEQALPIDARKPLGTALDAQIALEDAIKRERAYAPDPGTLRQLATRALELLPPRVPPVPKPAPVAGPVPTPAPAVEPPTPSLRVVDKPTEREVEPPAKPAARSKPAPKRQGPRTPAPPRPTPEEEEADEIAFLERELARLAAEAQQQAPTAPPATAPAPSIVSLSDPDADPLALSSAGGEAVVEVISETPRFLDNGQGLPAEIGDSAPALESPLVVVEYDAALEADAGPAWALTPCEDAPCVELAPPADGVADPSPTAVDRESLWLDFETTHVSRQVAQAATTAAGAGSIAAAPRRRTIAPLVARAAAPVSAGVCTTLGVIADAAKRYRRLASSDAPFARAHDAAEPVSPWLIAARSVMAGAATLAAIPARVAQPRATGLAKALTILPFVPAAWQRQAPAPAALPSNTLPDALPLALVTRGATIDFTTIEEEPASVFARAIGVFTSAGFRELDDPIDEPAVPEVDVIEAPSVSEGVAPPSDAPIEAAQGIDAIGDVHTADTGAVHDGTRTFAAIEASEIDLALDAAQASDAVQAIEASAPVDVVPVVADVVADAVPALAAAASSDASQILEGETHAEQTTIDYVELVDAAADAPGLDDLVTPIAEPAVASVDEVPPSVRLADAVAQLRKLVDEACGPVGLEAPAPVAADVETVAEVVEPVAAVSPSPEADLVAAPAPADTPFVEADAPTATTVVTAIEDVVAEPVIAIAAPSTQVVDEAPAETLRPAEPTTSQRECAASAELQTTPDLAPADAVVFETLAVADAAPEATVVAEIEETTAGAAASPSAVALDENDPEILALLRELEELEAAEAVQAREIADAPVTDSTTDAAVSVAVEAMATPAIEPAAHAPAAEFVPGHVPVAEVELPLPVVAPAELEPVAEAPSVVPAAPLVIADVPVVVRAASSPEPAARVATSTATADATRKPKRAKGGARKRGKREATPPAPTPVVQVIQSPTAVPQRVVLHVEAPPVAAIAAAAPAAPVAQPAVATFQAPRTYAPWEVPTAGPQASAPEWSPGDVARSGARRSSFLDAPMPSVLVGPPPEAEPSPASMSGTTVEPVAAMPVTSSLTQTAPLFESPSFSTAEHAVLSTAESVFDQEPAPAPTTKVHRFPTRFDPRHINWKRTLAASLLLMLLESAGFAAVYWLTQPKDIGYLNVRSSVDGLDVRIDGKSAGQTPLAIELPAGRHTIEMSGFGLTKVVPVEIASGVQTTQLVKWPRGQKVGTLQVASTPPGARVIIDGEMRGVTPVTIEGVPEGGHTLVLESDAGRVRQGVRVIANETTDTTVGIFAGWLNVFAPVQVRVFEDGKLLGTSEDGKLLLAPGEHRLELINPQLGLREQRTVEVTPGNTTTLSLDTPNGSLVVDAPDGTEVWIDGQQRGVAPMAPLNAAVGTREVILRHPQIGQRRFTVQVGVKSPARAEFFTP